MKNKQYHIVKIVTKSNRTIVLILLIVFDFSPFFAIMYICSVANINPKINFHWLISVTIETMFASS